MVGLKEDELWVDVNDYEGLYTVTPSGRIKSLNYSRTGTEKELTHVFVIGYRKVHLSKNSIQKLKSVHRIVAEAFIPNPENKPHIHHIDHNRGNCHVSNLMWVTASENSKYDYVTGGRIGKTNMAGKFGELNPGSKKVKKINANGSFEIIIGISEAARLVSGSASHIVKVCNGKLKHHKGYKWEYA